jgi:nucleoside-diphosphate-sugar epimerase
MRTFGKPSILIIGCGDIGIRVAKQLSLGHRVFALTSSSHRFQELREAGATPILGNLDQPESLWRLAGLAQTVIHLAPPQNQGNRDHRTRNLLRILSPRVFCRQAADRRQHYRRLRGSSRSQS